MPIESLSTEVRGSIIQKGEEGYENARKVYNAMIDKKPDTIVYIKIL